MNRVSPLACVLFLLALVGILTMGPWTGASFTILDNMLPELYARQGRSLLDVGLGSFSYDHRIQSFFFWPLEMLPSLPGHPWGYAAVKLGFLALAFGSFGFLIAKLSRRPILGAGAALFAVGTIQNQTDFDIINAFCVVFPLALSLAFFAASSAVSYGRSRRLRDLVLCVLFYLGALMLYEVFVTLPALLLGLAWMQSPVDGANEDGGSLGAKVRSYVLPTAILAAISIAFTASFFFLKKGHEKDTDDWTRMGSAAPAVLAKTGWQYAVGGFPGYHALHHRSEYNREILSQTHQGKDEFGSRGGNWVRLFNAPALVKGLAVAVGLALCLMTGSVSQRRILISLGLAGAYFALAPALTSSVSLMHQVFVESQGRLAHNTSNFSHFGWILLLATGGAGLLGQRWVSGHRTIRTLVLGFGALLGFGTSLLADFWNTHTNLVEARTADRWTGARALTQHPVFTALPEKATLHAPELSRGRTYQERNFYTLQNYWSAYYGALAGKPWELTRTDEEWDSSLADPERKSFRFLWVEDQQRDEQHALLAPVEPAARNFATRCTLFRFSPYRSFRISGPASGSWVSIGGLRVPVDRGHFQFAVQNDGAEEGISVLSIESDQPLHLPDLVLSTPFAPVEVPRPHPEVEVVFSDHFLDLTMEAVHREEQTFLECVSRSRSNQASLTLKNPRQKSVTGNLQMEVRSFGRGTLRVSTTTGEQALAFEGSDEEVKSFVVPLALAPGENRLELNADFAGKDGKSWVAYELINLGLELE